MTTADLIARQDLDALASWLDQAGILDIVEELTRLDPADRVVPFRLLPRDRALEVFEALDSIHQQEILEQLRDESFRQLVGDMDPDDRARLVGEVPATVASQVLAGLDPAERALTAALLGYPAESAGRIMTPEYVSLRAGMTVAEALEEIRRSGPDAETVYFLPVSDDHRCLVGVIGLRALVLAPPTSQVGELMTRRVHKVRFDEDQEVAARLIQEAGLIALPVVDTENRLVGVITVDDAMAVIEREDTEDIARHGGAEPLGRPYMAAGVFYLASKRAVWLLVLIVAAALTVNVLQFFEETLEEVVTLALFIPLLIDTGGNSGSQAATVVIRAMAVNEVRFSDLPRVLAREARVGVMLGTMLGVAGFVPVAIFFDTDIALIVSVTLVTICAWATFLGSMLPMVARRVGVDPAVASAPIVTTLVDATGLVIYFLVARAVLGV